MKQSERTQLMLRRVQRALDLRNEGMTYKEVGARLDPPVSQGRARQLIVKGERMNRSPGNSVAERLLATTTASAFSALPEQLKSALRSEFGTPSLVDDAEAEQFIRTKGVTIANGKALIGGKEIRGVGKVGARLLMQICGIEPPTSAPLRGPSEVRLREMVIKYVKANFDEALAPGDDFDHDVLLAVVSVLTNRENREKSGESA